MPAVVKVMKEDSTLVTLVKPQFEAKRSQVANICFSYKLFFLPGNYSFWLIGAELNLIELNKLKIG